MSGRVFVIGVGMTKFEKPGSVDWDYPDMGKIALERALADAAVPYDCVQQAAVGYVFGDSTCGQRALYEVGITGIPVYNVNNNCATGSTALYMAYQFIRGGISDCVAALGFEKMEKGSLGAKYQDRTNPLDKHVGVMMDTHGIAKAPFAPQMFGNAGREHMKLYGTKLEHFAKIAEKNHRHSKNNPYSQFRDVYTLDEIMKSKKVHEPLTFLQCCPTSDGAGAAILASESFVLRYGLQHSAVEIVGMSMATDLQSSFTQASMIKAVGFDMTKSAAESAFRQAGIGASDVQVIELHDCFSANELLTYEALGLCPVGGAANFIDSGNNTYGGKYVVNPSGGLISKGHPLGATGLAQCAELVWQVRGTAGPRQVQNVKYALQHNLGLGGAAVVTVYTKPKFPVSVTIPNNKTEHVGKDTATAPAASPSSSPAPSSSASSSSSSSSSSSPASAAPKSGSLKSDAVFDNLAARTNVDLVKSVGVVYRFDVSSDDGSFTKSTLVDLKNGNGKINTKAEPSAAAECIIIIKDSDLVSLLSGSLNAQKAFMSGKIKIKGNMMLAQKLQALSKPASKL